MFSHPIRLSQVSAHPLTIQGYLNSVLNTLEYSRLSQSCEPAIGYLKVSAVCSLAHITQVCDAHSASICFVLPAHAGAVIRPSLQSEGCAQRV